MYTARQYLLHFARAELRQRYIYGPSSAQLRMGPPEELARLLVIFPNPTGHCGNARQALCRSTMSGAQTAPTLIAGAGNDAVSQLGPFSRRRGVFHNVVQGCTRQAGTHSGIQVRNGLHTFADGGAAAEERQNILISNHRLTDVYQVRHIVASFDTQGKRYT
jgi:hypothetical protein